MKTRIDGRFSRKDFFAGLIFIGFGVFGLFVGWHYPVGTAARMGPGYFPMILSGLVLLIGGVIVTRSFFIAADRVGRFAFRPLTFVLGSAAVFAFLLNSAGLVLSTATLIFFSKLGSNNFHPLEILLLIVILTGLAVSVFVLGLGLPMSIWIPG
jgi:putative tricarboxylic transport membrane protein